MTTRSAHRRRPQRRLRPFDRLRLIAASALCILSLTIALLPGRGAASSAGPAARSDAERAARKRLALVQDEVTLDPAPGGEVAAVIKPKLLAASRAPLDDGEWVLGVALGDTAVAYPLRALAAHEVVNGWVGRHPVAVTYCPASGSAAVYARNLGDRRFTLGVSDRFWRGHRVLFDAETRSLWSQLLGECVRGDLEAQRFGQMAAVLARWKDWQRAYPATRVIDPEGAPPAEPFAARANASASPRDRAPSPLDAAAGLSPRDPVFGVILGRTAKAYPLAALRSRGVVEDRFRRLPIVFFHDEASGAVASYNRLVGGFEVHFEKGADGTIRDIGTQSRWDWLRGEAVEGKMAGVRLSRFVATPAFWSAWRDVFPGTEVYRAKP